MKLGIMQPYFMPYIGHRQLLNAVDMYVKYDDVNFIKGGWINRNRIIVGDQIKYFNIPMQGASPNLLINEISVNNDYRIINKNLRVLEGAYKKAPYFNVIMPLMEAVLTCGEERISDYITYSIRRVCDYLGIHTELILSSSLEKDTTLRGQEKVLEICRILGAKEYYNAIGGQELYSCDTFDTQGITLKFVKTLPYEYKQFNDNFEPNLSMIDVLMFNSKEQIGEMLEHFVLI